MSKYVSDCFDAFEETLLKELKAKRQDLVGKVILVLVSLRSTAAAQVFRDVFLQELQQPVEKACVFPLRYQLKVILPIFDLAPHPCVLLVLDVLEIEPVQPRIHDKLDENRPDFKVVLVANGYLLANLIGEVFFQEIDGNVVLVEAEVRHQLDLLDEIGIYVFRQILVCVNLGCKRGQVFKLLIDDQPYLLPLSSNLNEDLRDNSLLCEKLVAELRLSLDDRFSIAVDQCAAELQKFNVVLAVGHEVYERQENVLVNFLGQNQIIIVNQLRESQLSVLAGSGIEFECLLVEQLQPLSGVDLIWPIFPYNILDQAVGELDDFDQGLGTVGPEVLCIIVLVLKGVVDQVGQDFDQSKLFDHDLAALPRNVREIKGVRVFRRYHKVDKFQNSFVCLRQDAVRDHLDGSFLFEYVDKLLKNAHRRFNVEQVMLLLFEDPLNRECEVVVFLLVKYDGLSLKLQLLVPGSHKKVGNILVILSLVSIGGYQLLDVETVGAEDIALVVLQVLLLRFHGRVEIDLRQLVVQVVLEVWCLLFEHADVFRLPRVHQVHLLDRQNLPRHEMPEAEVLQLKTILVQIAPFPPVALPVDLDLPDRVDVILFRVAAVQLLPKIALCVLALIGLVSAQIPIRLRVNQADQRAPCHDLLVFAEILAMVRYLPNDVAILADESLVYV